jgi:hypothetical protein
MISPYNGLSADRWRAKTREIIKQHLLNSHEIYQIVIKIRNEIFQSTFTTRGYKIGVDLFPRPQIIGALLHELIPLEFSSQYPGIWRREENKDEKDIVYIPDDYFSIELKTSSSSSNIYGNRSYPQKSLAGKKSKKSKSGYYLAVNFQKFDNNIKGIQRPQITLVRFGWIDRDDWQGQKSQTGQQSRLSADVERYKLLILPLELE